jgi:hypothetical protein
LPEEVPAVATALLTHLTAMLYNVAGVAGVATLASSHILRQSLAS